LPTTVLVFDPRISRKRLMPISFVEEDLPDTAVTYARRWDGPNF